MVDQYSIIAEQENSTVVAHYEVPERDGANYQSEAQLESQLIKQLQGQGYEYPAIKNEQELVQNLRHMIELLNDYQFTDKEWKRYFEGSIANEAMTIEDKTDLIQRGDTVINITRDNGETKNIKLIDKRNPLNNRLQVINQYVPDGGTHANRYDVTILVNGLPLVHIELKKRGISIREAFNQINRYQRESFWAGKALFDYAQVFVISNGTQTKYYSNTTRFAREQESEKQQGKKKKIESNSFEFTSYWSDADNRLITDLEDFTTTFLSKRTLMNILTRYCVYTVDRNLLVMRPYQIAATERILRRIQTAIYNKWQGSILGGGYIWHTTGSGKTLTSFKTAQLATQIEGVSKVLFVVDRQDLDYQTMKEYDNFEKDCANGNNNWKVLENQLKNPTCRIIITTIQKMSNLLKRSNLKELPLLQENVVFIFDECHRSQFGQMHQLIVKKFKKWMMFGFTGTPIFPQNCQRYGTGQLTTTAQVFGGELDDEGRPTRPLHTYTIINAIKDKNVLKFRVDYIRTVKMKDGVKDEEVWGIDDKKALMDPERISKNVGYILDNFDFKTKRSESYTMSTLQNVVDVIKNTKRLRENQVAEDRRRIRTKGFNSILAVNSVPMAISYYKEFMRQMAQPDAKKLRIATIFTFAANEDENENLLGLIDEDPGLVETLDQTSKEFLDQAIADYNTTFGTNYDTSSDKFQNYYKDISLRMKNKDIDLLIVVGMFLTGFDAKTLNTLWVDKDLRMHGLLQAYSRTNRILNSVKDCGNIVCFRNLEKQTNDCFALFGDKDAGGLILMRPFNDYYFGYEEKEKHHAGYQEIALALLDSYPTSSLADITDEKQKKDFVRLFGSFLRAENLLTAFDDFNPRDLEELKRIRIIRPRDKQDYLSWYQELHEELRGTGKGGEKVDIHDDLEFEIALVKQVQVDITYILALVQAYKQSNCEDKEIVLKIMQDVSASPDLRDKKELIQGFVDRVNPEGDVSDDWATYINEQYKQELEDIITSENLKPEPTREFVKRAFEDEYVEESGMALVSILPPMPVFGAGNKRAEKKSRVIERLKAFLSKFMGMGCDIEQNITEPKN